MLVKHPACFQRQGFQSSPLRWVRDLNETLGHLGRQAIRPEGTCSVSLSSEPSNLKPLSFHSKKLPALCRSTRQCNKRCGTEVNDQLNSRAPPLPFALCCISKSREGRPMPRNLGNACSPRLHDANGTLGPRAGSYPSAKTAPASFYRRPALGMNETLQLLFEKETRQRRKCCNSEEAGTTPP